MASVFPMGANLYEIGIHFQRERFILNFFPFQVLYILSEKKKTKKALKKSKEANKSKYLDVQFKKMPNKDRCC